VSVVSQNATLPVAFSANDDADNCNSNLAVQAPQSGARGPLLRGASSAVTASRKKKPPEAHVSNSPPEIPETALAQVIGDKAERA
jgi:hypothetical protein